MLMIKDVCVWKNYDKFGQQEGTGKKIVPQVEFVDVGKFLEE